MTILQSSISQAASGDYQIARSLRFNSADSAYLTRTPASAGNRRTWTWSGWVKPSNTGTNKYKGLIECVGPTSPGTRTSFVIADTGSVNFFTDNSSTGNLITTQLLRDFSAWYHILLAVDTTQATASNRLKLYINGVQVTAFATASYPAQNLETQINNTFSHDIGKVYDPFYADYYLTEVNLIDGQQLTPSSFGQTNTNTGIWDPIAYSGSYGTNGFKLNFSDNSNTTAATLGKDSSGNGNNFTPNNFSVTAGSGNDSLVDTPTNYGTDTGGGGEVRGNYATWNNLYGSGGTFTNGNLNFTAADNGLITPTTFFPTTGKWYCETVLSSGSNPRVGITNNDTRADLGGTTNSWAYLYDGRLYHNASVIGNTGVSPSYGDVVMMALDIDAGKLWFGINGTWMSSGVPSTGTNPQFTFTANQALSFAVASGGGVQSWTGNFGQRAFAYTAPSGFKALCTQNLPTPVIGASSTTLASKNFNTTLYTGNGTSNSNTQSITGVGFQPDLVWIKNRSTGVNHVLMDVVRGTSPILSSNAVDTEATFDASWRSSYGQLTAFGSDGFTVAAGTVAGGNFNYSGQSYVSWNWKAGGTGISNTSGTITSTVSANPTAGISVVTWTGNGLSNATVGHGLGAVPAMIICKERTGTDYWHVKHKSLTTLYNAFLNVTNAETAAAAVGDGVLGDLNSSTTFGFATAGSPGNVVAVNENGITNVAYCFAEIAGFSKFSKYIGNGSTDGPFVYCGFRPRWVLIKQISGGGGSWELYDTARDTYNQASQILEPNSSGAEQTSAGYVLDILSNGFKLRGTASGLNSSAAAYIFAAFAESPFNYSRAR